MNTTMEAGRQPEQQTGLGEIERVVDAFVAPNKTFIDIRRSASWWLPFLLGILVSFFFVTSVDRTIGFDQVAQINMTRNSSMQERMSMVPADQKARIEQSVADWTKYISYAFPAITLIVALIAAGILMASFNFGLGAKASFKQYFAVWFYAGLPMLIKYVLAGIVIFAGASAEQFDMRNPVGTNVGWYMTDSPTWLRTLLSSADIFTIWTVVLLILGCATVAKMKRSSAAVLVVGWWVLIILVGTVAAAFQG